MTSSAPVTGRRAGGGQLAAAAGADVDVEVDDPLSLVEEPLVPAAPADESELLDEVADELDFEEPRLSVL